MLCELLYARVERDTLAVVALAHNILATVKSRQRAPLITADSLRLAQSLFLGPGEKLLLQALLYSLDHFALFAEALADFLRRVSLGVAPQRNVEQATGLVALIVFVDSGLLLLGLLRWCEVVTEGLQLIVHVLAESSRSFLVDLS